MANVNFWYMPISGRKTQVARGKLDVAACSIANACPTGYVGIFCNDAVFNAKALVKNIGQDAIDVLRDGLIDHSRLVTGIADLSAYFSTVKLNNPRPLVTSIGYVNPNGTLINVADPAFQVGIIMNGQFSNTTGLAFTALQRLRDYISETNGVIP